MSIQKVLYCDDEPDIRKIARMSLASIGGWSVSLASSGQEAIALAIQVQPDVILLDVMMPGMDGPATLEQLRENPLTSDIPVVFLTAKVQPHEVESYLKLGAVGVIAKPFDPITLPDQIRELIQRGR